MYNKLQFMDQVIEHVYYSGNCITKRANNEFDTKNALNKSILNGAGVVNAGLVDSRGSCQNGPVPRVGCKFK